VLCNLDFIEAKCTCGLTFDLVQGNNASNKVLLILNLIIFVDFINATTALQEKIRASPDRRQAERESLHIRLDFSQYSNFVRLNAQFFSSNPTAVYQQV
jgi:hypothetical protein